MIDITAYGDVYPVLVKLLENHGFELQVNGDMTREEPWYSFPVEELININSVMHFQLRWGRIYNPQLT